MEEEKKAKVSISVILLIIALIVIVVMGIFIFKLNKDKKELEEAHMYASEQIRNLNEKTAKLQGTIDNVSNTINSSKNNEIVKDINCNASIGNVEVFSDEYSGNTRIHVNGTINLSFDKNKYEGIMLSGYCLGSNGEKYLMHGPGDGRTLYSNNGDNDTVLSLTENIPQDIKYSDGTVKGWSEIDWNNVKIKYCKIDKLEAVLKDGSSVEMELNYEKNF